MAPVRGWLRRARAPAGGAPTSAGARPDRHGPHLRALHVRRHGGGAASRRPAAIELGESASASARRWSSVGWPPARITIFDGHVDEGLEQLDEVGAVPDVGRGRSADDRDDVLRADLRRPGAGPARPGARVDRGHGALAPRRGVRRHQRPVPGPPGRDAADLRSVRRRRGRGARCVRRAAAVDASGVRLAARRARHHPPAQGRPGRGRGGLPSPPTSTPGRRTRAGAGAPGAGRRRRRRRPRSPTPSTIPFDTPSKERPPFGDLRLAPLLDAQAEIAAAAGDAGTARRAADALRSIADTYDSRRSTPPPTSPRPGWRCSTAISAGDRRAPAARSPGTELGAPFEAAVARVVLGDVHHRGGDVDQARMEWEAAQAAFQPSAPTAWAERVGAAAVDGRPPAGDRRRRRHSDRRRSATATPARVCFGGARCRCAT